MKRRGLLGLFGSLGVVGPIEAAHKEGKTQIAEEPVVKEIFTDGPIEIGQVSGYYYTGSYDCSSQPSGKYIDLPLTGFIE